MPSGFDDRAFERAIKDAADKAVEQRAAELQRIFDSLHRTCSGKPVEEVKRALRQRWRSLGDGADITDPELTEYATLIAEGTKIKMRPGKVA
jgi:hypothetical protein